MSTSPCACVCLWYPGPHPHSFSHLYRHGVNRCVYVKHTPLKRCRAEMLGRESVCVWVCEGCTLSNLGANGV
jgi:hypothetical protein